MLDEKLYKELVQWAHDSQIALATFREFIPDLPSNHEVVLREKIDKARSALGTLEAIASHGLVTRYLSHKRTGDESMSHSTLAAQIPSVMLTPTAPGPAGEVYVVSGVPPWKHAELPPGEVPGVAGEAEIGPGECIGGFMPDGRG